MSERTPDTEPGADRNTDAERRAALLDQLGYLLAEVDALAPILKRIPADALRASLPGERSLLEAFAHLAALDRTVYLPWLERIVAEDEPALPDAGDPDGTVRDDLGAALADLRGTREALVAAFQRVPEDDWARTATFPDGDRADVYGLALAIAHRDAAELRRLAYRMHEAHLTDRSVDLPK